MSLLHVHFGYAIHDVTAVARWLRLPLVLSLHGEDATALPRREPAYYDTVTRAVDAVVVPSRFLAERVQQLGFPATSIRIIPSGVDTAFFTPQRMPDGPPVVTFVGRLVEKKGLDVLLRAWPVVRARVPDAELRLIGQGELQRIIPADDPSIRHHPPAASRRREQVRQAIHASRVVVTPSRTASDGDAESLLLVNLEAQACGRPLVTSRHGGIPEYVREGDSALLVPEGEVADLAAAIIAVLTDRQLAERLAVAGPPVAASYDVHRCAGQLDDLYQALTARAAGSGRRPLARRIRSPRRPRRRPAGPG